MPSRRLGRSLGVNVTPLKTCSYNCIYCQLGKTTKQMLKCQEFYVKEDIIAELKSVIKNKNAENEIDYITFAGEGEPTLCCSLGEYISFIKKECKIPVAVITNGSALSNKDVRRSLLEADLVMPSLDAGTTTVFKKINRPLKEVNLDIIANGIAQFKKEFIGQLWLEIMLVKGVNDSESELKALKRRINVIKPDKININVPIRPPAESWVQPPDKDKIDLAHKIIGDVFEITDQETGEFSVERIIDPIEAIETIIRRHPMREEQVLQVLQKFDKKHLEAALKYLTDSKKIMINKYEGTIFYRGIGKKEDHSQSSLNNKEKK